MASSILVVDDARSTLRALEAILSREGYTVLSAASGEEALTHIEKHDVDLLLCDVKMPVSGRPVWKLKEAPTVQPWGSW